MSTQQEETKENFLTRSKAFKSLVKWAFTVCDTDKTGSIHKDELYTGVLLVHLKIAKYAGGAACFPASRETIDKLFDASDVDKSGTIDEDEFQKIMVVCCGQILSRVVLYLAMLLFIVPTLAHGLIVYLTAVLADKSWFQAIAYAVQSPISKVEWLDAMFDWDTLIEDVLGIGIFFALFPIVFGAIDEFYQKAAESKMLDSIEIAKKKKES